MLLTYVSIFYLPLGFCTVSEQQQHHSALADIIAFDSLSGVPLKRSASIISCIQWLVSVC
jgi:hypothetical protein